MLPVLSVSLPFIFNQKYVNLSFLCLFPVSLEMCPFWIVAVRHMRKKINHTFWDYSVINRIAYHSFLNFLPSVTGNEITVWYVPISIKFTLLVRELDLTQDTRCLWKFGQDRFQNKSLRHFFPVHCLSLMIRELIQHHSWNFTAFMCPKKN